MARDNMLTWRNVAIKTHRPNMLVFHDWMRECLEYLAHSPILIDRQVAAWFELQRIFDETTDSLGFGNSSSAAPLVESHVRDVLIKFDNQMQSWKTRIPMGLLLVITGFHEAVERTANLLLAPLFLEYHYTNLAMYELVTGKSYQDPDAIKQPFYTLPLPGAQPQSTLKSTTHMEITIKWMILTHELLDRFLSCNTGTMRQIPSLIYTRVGTAVLSLLEIHVSAVSGDFAVFFEPQDVQVYMYLNAMAKRLAEASDGGKYMISSRWYHVIAAKGRDWYDRFQKGRVQQEAGS